MKPGDQVIINIKTTVESVEELGNYDPDQFNGNPFVSVKYGDGYMLELPRYSIDGTAITVEPQHKAVDKEPES